jgi:hypothetical protein
MRLHSRHCTHTIYRTHACVREPTRSPGRPAQQSNFMRVGAMTDSWRVHMLFYVKPSYSRPTLRPALAKVQSPSAYPCSVGYTARGVAGRLEEEHGFKESCGGSGVRWGVARAREARARFPCKHEPFWNVKANKFNSTPQEQAKTRARWTGGHHGDPVAIRRGRVASVSASSTILSQQNKCGGESDFERTLKETSWWSFGRTCAAISTSTRACTRRGGVSPPGSPPLARRARRSGRPRRDRRRP